MHAFVYACGVQEVFVTSAPSVHAHVYMYMHTNTCINTRMKYTCKQHMTYMHMHAYIHTYEQGMRTVWYASQ
jgi:hypothetical protein